VYKMSISDYGMDIGEQVISDTLKKVSEGEITFDDTENLYEDGLTNDERIGLSFLGIHDKFDFRESIENES
tara:strand:+ start:148 stop:360 length:213 start_codon:yes stop_codon:yes gene_type:complete